MAKLLITGCNGFIGQHLSSFFLQAGWDVVGVDRTPPAGSSLTGLHFVSLDLTKDSFLDLVKAHQPQALIHAAGTSNVSESIHHPYKDFSHSVLVWANILEALRVAAPACKSIFLSSAAVYGNPQKLPVSEVAELKPLAPYGHHKQICEQMADYYAHLYGVKISIARIFSAYGRGLRRQVIWDICEKAFSQPVIELNGTGEESRDFIQVLDIAQAVNCLLDKGDFRAGVYNLAGGRSTTIRELAGAIIQLLNIDKPVHFNSVQRRGDPLYWQADISRLVALGFQPWISLENGLADYVSWFQQIKSQPGLLNQD